MTEKKQNIEINNIIKTCLDEIYLLNSDAMSDTGQHISSRLRIDDFGDDSDVKVSCRYEAEKAGVIITIEYRVDAKKKRFGKMFRLMNLMNLEFLEIGTMSFIEETGIVRLAAQIPVAGDNLSRVQLKGCLDRLLSKVAHTCILITPFASNSNSPESVMAQLMTSIMEKQFQTNMPIGNQTDTVH